MGPRLPRGHFHEGDDRFFDCDEPDETGLIKPEPTQGDIILPGGQLALPGIGTLHGVNREQWMSLFAQWISPYFAKAGHQLPTRIRFGIGRLLGGRANVIGRCHPHTWSSDGTYEITVDLSQDDSTTVGATITHELIHAALECKGGHGKGFRRLMPHVGLCGNPTATEPTIWLCDLIQGFVQQYGIFPHASMSKNAPRRRKKADGQGYHKLICPACRWSLRMTRKMIRVALPPCANAKCSRYGKDLLVEGDFPDEPQHPDQPED
jgi:hypothetical protein